MPWWMQRRHIFIGTLAILLPTAAAQCTREGLLLAADTYIAAQTSGNIASLPLATTNFTYQENNKKVDIKTGILSQPLKIDLNRSTADTVACASYTMFISTTGSQPHVVATQIRHIDNDSSSIALIDTIAATTGDLFFNAAQTLNYIRQENWTTIEDASQRPSRDILRRAGDAYLDMWTNATAADAIPWGTDCERVEGSMLTRPCGGQLPRGGSTKPNGSRRYVIDETMGSVDVLCAFDSLGNYPDSHEIRIVAGKVKYVHTITVDGN
ncbi:uncharacterized protein BCR38DRAFT_414727 [Pseudomassariella vexata]|uniref:DUF8021 domain-containing protein n=1 Tax=Pseudomassariella vexata TaxID=1141098 RepID=A0A1Y2D9C8_9PEZI|nr:uncharacterized protein BCR38DRAFT_414727 [Pseudomassariella vexata]ORY55869.1 hypothetical protein BCR38DRAFT_414727 [Pseudomassariella vexata]